MQILLNCVKESLMQFVNVINTVATLNSIDAEKFYINDNAGRHVRHVVDHFQAFLNCFDKNLLNYNLRNRNSEIERNYNFAKIKLNQIINQIMQLSEHDNREITIISEIDPSSSVDFTFKSNICRELLYLINHTIHHAAYVKLLAKNANIKLAENIGIAPATASFLREAE